ncbi:hypothetical protein SDC9_79337 [bioreactor metagenome]|uniref:Uncharacterized protein n=1 Tax=bioreactor metagenome TaxID=1076179 RepID=A0A644YWC3_9ZZZZ
MNNKNNSGKKTSTQSSMGYSSVYTEIKSKAESRWPEWKIDTYNSGVAVSAHAKKILAK